MAVPVIQGTQAGGQVTTRNTGTASTTYTGDAPAGIVAGEVLVAIVRVGSGASAASLSDLQGFGLQISRTASSGATFILAKVATSTDAANAGVTGYYNFVGDASFMNSVSLCRISGAAYPFNASEMVSEAEVSSTSYTMPPPSPR